MSDSARVVVTGTDGAGGASDVMSEAWSGRSPGQTLALQCVGVLGFAGLTGVAAQVAIPLAPYGIPLTLQTLAVSVCALTLGGRLGTLSMVLYVLLGAVGLPMFAEGAGGFSYVFGQTGGYLAGFVIAQPIVAMVARSQVGFGGVRIGTRGGPTAVCAAVLAGHGVVFVLGVTWLKLFRDVGGAGIGWGEAWFFGCVVFLPGMFAKAGLAATFGPRLIRMGRRAGF
jgi:biotin transport system substrate-specific component